MKTLVLVLGLIVFASCQSTQDARNKQKADLHLRLGTSSLEKGNFPDALKDLLVAETLDSNNPLIQNNLGLAYYMRDRVDQAEVHIRRAIEIEPKFTDAKNNLGRVLIAKKKYSESKKILNEVLEDLTYPFQGKVYINLGLACFEETQFNDAKDYFLKAITFDRENCLAQNYYARTLLELKDFKRAITGFDKAEAFCSKQSFDEPAYFSAVTSYRMGDIYKAKLKFEALVDKNSTYREKAEQMLEILRK
jgi:Tfp pilus assembly protein PilF